MEGDDDDSILGLDVHIDDDQPPPRTDQRPAISPDAGELLTGAREFLQREQRARDPFASVGRKLAGLDQLTKLVTRQARDLDRRHRLELGERDRLAAPSLLDRILRPLPGARNPIEDFSDPRGIRIGFVESAGEK